MKIRNQTAWRTDQLKAILQHAAEIELEPAKRKALIVTVCYTRGHYSSGCAYVGGRHATVRIRHPFSRKAKALHVPHDDPRRGSGTWGDGKGNSGKVVWDQSQKALSADQQTELVLHFASVAAHEFAHIRGQHHDTMSAKYKWHGNWREYVQWAAAFPLETKPVKAKAKPTVDAKLAHVLKMKALAETRVKRATTVLKKWKTRERYYLKAAQRAQQTASAS